MKILYKLGIKDQQDFISEIVFDRYDAIEDGLEDNYGEDFKLKELKIMTLMKCEGCLAYTRYENICLIKKYDYTVNYYCAVCVPNFEMNIKPFIKKQEK